jgi:integrase
VRCPADSKAEVGAGVEATAGEGREAEVGAVRALGETEGSAGRAVDAGAGETAYDDHGLVFARPDGRPIHPEFFSRTFDRVVARSDLPAIRPHDLRHTHASLLLRAGVPVKVVSERLGHASPGFTLNVYQHVIPGMQAEAAATFSRLLSPPG